MGQEPKKRTRTKLRAGDVFELTVPDGRLGYGVIVVPGNGVPYIIILRSLHQSEPRIAELAGDEIALVGWTMDALIYHGRWRVVGHDFPRRIDVPFPNFKVGMEGRMYITDVSGKHLDEATADQVDLLDYRFSRAPIGFQAPFEALHGFGECREDFDKITPAYARQRMIRPSNAPSSFK